MLKIEGRMAEESAKDGNEEAAASEQDGLSAHSPFQPPRSSASSLPKELPQVELELRLLEALEIYHPVKLQGIKWRSHQGKSSRIKDGLRRDDQARTRATSSNPAFPRQGLHRHFVLYGLMEYLRRRLSRNFSPDEVLQLLDRFYNLEMLKPDDDEIEALGQEEEFSLPHSVFMMKDD
ncbi:uncharacterized protein LOC131049626 isoform X1 [Cryptomeria japonica]|uniref:uncharacterized protein LOC131049626 isoform X1 n=1 Tax=Cryptomeria japonica TaxID=3369 RepID=UPI0025AD22C8|nr:uncharacterized protein LOC131049626 isoform X1 [Cryptomeria japonica]